MEFKTKLCLKCGLDKPLENFALRKRSKDGRHTYCHICGNKPKGPRLGLAIQKARKDAEREAKWALWTPPPNKRCPRCKTEKPREQFSNCKTARDGKYCYCIECHRNKVKESARISERQRQRDNRSPFNETKRCPSCKTHKPLIEFYTSAYSVTGRNSHCKKCIRARYKDRYATDLEYREKLISKRREYYASNREKCKESKRHAAQKYPERHKNNLRRRRQKLNQRIEYRLEGKTRSMIHQIIKRSQLRKGWRKVLGYTFEDLKAHIESLFTDGMTWGAVMNREIEIDHVIPRAAFYYETIGDPDFKECWSLSNLQPLWRSENRAKCDKMPDGSDGRLIGKRKREQYEFRLAQMAAGGSSELPSDYV